MRMVATTVLVTLISGCPAGKEETPSAGGDKVLIRGSNTFGEELAPRLISAYKKDHPKAEFDVECKATVYGFGALLGGRCDIAAASRPPLKDELELATLRGVQMNDYQVGYFAVAIIVNSGNSVTGLTKEQVHGIFTGRIRNWKEVGGPEGAIALYIRDPISGVNLGFKELAMSNNPYAPEAKLLTDYAAIVKSVAADPNAIGYCGLDSAAVPGLKALPVGGVEPGSTTVHQGTYPYARPVQLHTAKGRESDITKEFIKFVQSDAGKEVILHTGFTP